MAKKKKRERGAAPHRDDLGEGGLSGARTSEAASAAVGGSSPAPELAGAHAVAAGAVDRFDPFGSPRARLLANAFIVLFLAYQLGMPLRYYMTGRGLDERFSWRMFSTVRMLDCDVTVSEHVDAGDGPRRRRVDLKKEVQVAWIGLLERGRELVIEKLLARRCGEQGVVKVDYHLACKGPDGSKWPNVDRHMMCSDRAVAAGRGAP